MMPYGGHNVLEPAALGVPVVVGPYTYNFSEIVAILQSAGALRVAQNHQVLVTHISAWLNDSEGRDLAGAAGRHIVAQNRGAAAKVIRMVEQMIAAPTVPSPIIGDSAS